MTRHSKSIGTFLGTLLLAAGLTLGLGAPPALGGDVDVPSSGSFTLPDGETARIEFQVDISSTPGTQVCNQGTVSGTNITGSPVSTDDPDTGAAGDATCTDIVISADLGVTKADDVDPVTDGATLVYTITVINNGPDDAANVVVTDTLPIGGDVTFGFTNADTTCDEEGGVLGGSATVPTCTFANLADGASETFTITVTVSTGGAKLITNDVAVVSDAADPVSGNDSDSETTNVVVTVTLTVVVAGDGQGKVTGAGIDCGVGTTGDCSDVVTPGTVVVLTAAAVAGSDFDGWTNCDSEAANVCTQTVGGDETVTANFVDLKLLTVVVDGSGQGSVAGTGIDCGFGTTNDCSQFVTSGTVVVLTAAPEDAGSAFDGWTNCDSEAANVCTQTVDGDETVTATFVDLKLLTVVVDGSGQGSVAGTGIDCGFGTTNDCSQFVTSGTVVVLTAAPEDAGSVFDSWTTCDSAAANVCTQTVTGDETVTATFIDLKTLTITPVPVNGTITGGDVPSGPEDIECPTPTNDCTEDYLPNTEVDLVATPDATFLFGGWVGACTFANPSATCENLVMDADKTVSANFLSVADATAALNALVDGLPINNGQKKSLSKKKEGALKNFNKGDIDGAVDKLTSFINQLDGFVNGGIITQAEADPLIDAALAIINAILP